jgi:hypothetical protein
MTSTTPIYNPNVPQRKDNFSSSQGDFLSNFMSIYNAFKINHVALDSSSNAGNHTIIQLKEQDANAPFQTDVGEISIYCKPVENQGDQVFLRYQGNQNEFQLSAYQIFAPPVIDNDSIVQTPFFTYLPGRVLLYFGTIECTLSNAATPLRLRPPIATNIISVNLSVEGTITNQRNLPPWVTISPKNGNGFYETINLFKDSSLFPGPSIELTYFYMVLANI